MAEDKGKQDETNAEKKTITISLPRISKLNPWMITTFVLLAVSLVLLLQPQITGQFISGGISGNGLVGGISAQQAGEKAVKYINDNLVQSGEATFVSAEEFTSDMYKVVTNYQGNDIDVYVTKDGKWLFASTPFDTGEQQAAITTTTQPPSQITEVSADDDPSKGPIDAPVTIIEFSDFQCPFCKRVLPEIEQVLKTYGNEIRLVFRDFPLGFHQYAQKAAEAAECADDQGKFWEMHDKLFENQAALDVESLKQYAKDIGLNSETFGSCLDSGKYEDEVKKDLQDGQSYGVSGTPTFFINGKKLVGAQPFDAFKQLIDQELAGK